MKPFHWTADEEEALAAAFAANCHLSAKARNAACRAAVRERTPKAVEFRVRTLRTSKEEAAAGDEAMGLLARALANRSALEIAWAKRRRRAQNPNGV
jgi:hypothetical protein